MIGDSILAHAGETADAKVTPNLGLADTDVDWEGHSSMRVQELQSILQFGMLQGRCLSMIVLHLGGNNIDNMNQWKNLNKIRSNVNIFFVIFLVLHWFGQIFCPNFSRRKLTMLRYLKLRKKVNRMIKGVVLKH